MTAFVKKAAQGEVNVEYIGALPDSEQFGLVPVQPVNGHYIVGHSESGHHHVIPAGGITVMERTKNVPAGMRIFYAILESPSSLIQDASHPHETINLRPGIIEIPISREYNPFLDQARRVAD